MGSADGHLGVRCYIDEILIPRLPTSDKLKAEMTVCGANIKIPLEFVRVQPFVSPKIHVQAKTSQVQATAQRLQDTVALYVAIGGGYWNAKSL